MFDSSLDSSIDWLIDWLIKFIKRVSVVDWLIAALSYYMNCNFFQLSLAFFGQRNFSVTPHRLAGHSHWKNVKGIKGANDAIKSDVAQRAVRDIKRAVAQKGSANPKDNSELARVIQVAKSQNVAGATIDRALASLVANKDKPLHNLLVEMKGPAGALMILELSTTNPKKARMDLNTLLKKNVATTVDGGGIMHLFDQKTMVIGR